MYIYNLRYIMAAQLWFAISDITFARLLQIIVNAGVSNNDSWVEVVISHNAGPNRPCWARLGWIQMVVAGTVQKLLFLGMWCEVEVAGNVFQSG